MVLYTARHEIKPSKGSPRNWFYRLCRTTHWETHPEAKIQAFDDDDVDEEEEEEEEEADDDDDYDGDDDDGGDDGGDDDDDDDDESDGDGDSNYWYSCIHPVRAQYYVNQPCVRGPGHS